MFLMFYTRSTERKYDIIVSSNANLMLKFTTILTVRYKATLYEISNVQQ